LAEVGEVRYGDKAYSGGQTKGYDVSMKRAARGHPLGISDILRNERISKRRSPVERCFSGIKTVSKSGHVMVTTVENAAMKVMFKTIGYNLYNPHGLVNKKVV
jgi:IS5 family transposase